MTMQQDPRSPSLRRRRLSAELRRARQAAGLTSTKAAKELKWSPGKLSLIENAELQSVKPDDLDKMLDLYEIGEKPKREALHQLARDAKVRGWWTHYKDVFKSESLPDFEAEASRLRTYEAQIFPGLLQTPAYAEALLLGGRYINPQVVERYVHARMGRRSILTRFNPVNLRAVIDESAFHRVLGGGHVMLEQLQHLLHMAQMPHIDVQVLPLNQGTHAGFTAPFIILDFPSALDTPIVCIETLADALYLEKPDDVGLYNATFEDLQGSALSSSESAEYIAERITSLEGSA